jgi:hypothetical protein
MAKTWVVLAGVGLSVSALIAQAPDARRALIARAKSLELNTPYVPPPGDPLEHYASGYAKVMCSAVFVTGLDPLFAAENVGYFTAPLAERARLGTPKIDREKRTVEVTVPNGVARVAKQVGQPGVRHAPDRQDRRVLQTVDREKRVAGSEDATLADGRSDPCGRATRWRGHG